MVSNNLIMLYILIEMLNFFIIFIGVFIIIVCTVIVFISLSHFMTQNCYESQFALMFLSFGGNLQ